MARSSAYEMGATTKWYRRDIPKSKNVFFVFELEASGWYGSIRLVEAVLTKLVANSGNTGKNQKWPPSWKNLEKRQKTYFTVFFIYGVGGMGGAFTIERAIALSRVSC